MHDELAQLLSESLAARASAKSTTTPVPDDLEGLLSESLVIRDREAAAKKALAAAKKGFVGFSKEEAEACNAIVAQWETEQNWNPVQDLAVFHRTTCNCGAVHTVFSRFMQRQDHKRNGSARWVTVEEIDVDLPRASAVQDFTCVMCTECSEDYEFSPDAALPLEDYFATRELISGVPDTSEDESLEGDENASV